MVGARGQAERIEIVDALRGFALLGILLANILYWSGWTFRTEAQQLAFAGAEAVAWQYRFHHFLIDGKFYTLFSLLFGAGFALQIVRLNARGAAGLRIYRRRVLILLGIGLAHSFLIWDGDILTLYALLGLVLPLFFHWSERRLLVAAGVLIFVLPPLAMAGFARLGWAPHEPIYAFAEALSRRLGADPSPQAGLAWFQRTDLAGWVAWATTGPVWTLGMRIETWRIPKVLGFMLVGIVVGRRLAAGTLLDDSKLLRRALIAGLALGLPLSAVFALTPKLGQASWPSLFGTVPLALAYGAGFVLAWPKAQAVLRHFAPVGRMALTNYLTHSLIGLVFFYGIGFGLGGTMRPLTFYGTALGIFALQMLCSRWWLARHEQGPAEALWRAATYRGHTTPATTQSG